MGWRLIAKCFLCDKDFEVSTYDDKSSVRYQVTFKKRVVHEDGEGLTKRSRTKDLCIDCYETYYLKTFE